MDSQRLAERVVRLVLEWWNTVFGIIGIIVLLWELPLIVNKLSENTEAWIDVLDRILELTPFDSWDIPLFLFGAIMVAIPLHVEIRAVIRALYEQRRGVS